MASNKNKIQKTTKQRDGNGRYLKKEVEDTTVIEETKEPVVKDTTVAKAVVSPIGELEENPVPKKSGDSVTSHGNTIHFS
tara:strand:+ start:3560 stop:3799 length:240 start_codon:yes stop_codon:yes gene_type:complete